jgi:hypothetical protein
LGAQVFGQARGKLFAENVKNCNHLLIFGHYYIVFKHGSAKLTLNELTQKRKML